MFLLRSVTGMPLREHIRQDLNIINMNDKILEYRREWREHVERVQ